MKTVGQAKLIALVFMMMHATSSDTIPSILVGKWQVGRPYNTPGSIGITADQEAFIRRLQLVYTAEHLRVCGKDIPIQPIKMKSLTGDEFLQIYGFPPRMIGFHSLPIIDFAIDPSNGMNACGEYEDPGKHILIDHSDHVVMEVSNDYFPLMKSTRPQSK